MRLDLLNIQVKRKYSLPENWNIYQWAAKPEGGPMTYSEVTGVSAPLKPGKTDPIFDFDWKKRDKSTKATFTITNEEHEEFLSQWEAETGKCRECIGEGKNVSRCGVNIETECRPCRLCGGTGKPKLHEDSPND